MSQSLPTYSVQELNASIGELLERGFAPRFSLVGNLSKCQLKKGHLWMTITDGKASIRAVIWSSLLPKLKFTPKENDGVVIIGKINFWQNRASLIVQVLDIKISLETVLHQFEVVRAAFDSEGLLDHSRKRSLPNYPQSIAILTSSPSSALSDMLRTSRDRWPLTKIFVFPIPVQGSVSRDIRKVILYLKEISSQFKLEAVILARGGGNREDLMIFDDENVCRDLSSLSIPLITGIGHEDDLTVADLIADHRASTPTGAIVDLLPSKQIDLLNCLEKRKQLDHYAISFIRQCSQEIFSKWKLLKNYHPSQIISYCRKIIQEKYKIINTLSLEFPLKKGFAIIRNQSGEFLTKVDEINLKDKLRIQLSNGILDATVDRIEGQQDKS